VQLQHAPVVRRLGDQQDHSIGTEVARLQERLSFDSLEVHQP
jgi:hypothetical protein